MGEHNAEKEQKYDISNSGAFLAVGATVAVASLLGVAGAGTASASPSGEATDVRSAAFSTGVDLDAIAQCESSGNPGASNGSHFGLFQFDLRTWASVGGKGSPSSASVAEQYARAQALIASRGTQPWDASKACWAGKSAPSPKIKAVKPSPKPRAVAPAPKTHAPKTHTPIHESVVQDQAKVKVNAQAGTHPVVRGDTLTSIAERYGIKGGWQELFNLNRDRIHDANLIYTTQVLKLA
jgi:resuscitation-promoting factor RpfA